MLNSGAVGVGDGVGCCVFIDVGLVVGCCDGLAVTFGATVVLADSVGAVEVEAVGVAVGVVVAEVPKVQPALGSTSKPKHEGKKAAANKTVKNISILPLFIFQSAYTSRLILVYILIDIKRLRRNRLLPSTNYKRNTNRKR